MRRLAVMFLVLASQALQAGGVRFVSPLDGAQALGPMLLEVSAETSQIDRVDFFVDGVLAGAARTPPYRIYFDFGTASLSARSVSAKVWTAGYTSFETAEVRTAGMTANETLNVDVVEVPLRLRSARKLTAADLVVRENGVVQLVRELKAERPPAHFAFVIDRSLSMNGGKLGAALAAVESGLRQLRAGDSASLVLFNHHVARPVLISHRDPLADHFGGTSPSGGTSLRDALASVACADRTYAIVITDGGDRNSVLADEAALRKISGTKTVVNALILGESHTRFLDRAASNTGGTVTSATPASVAVELSRLLADINSRHLVVYQSQGTKRGWRSIEVSARGRNVSVTNARRGYFAEP